MEKNDFGKYSVTEEIDGYKLYFEVKKDLDRSSDILKEKANEILIKRWNSTENQKILFIIKMFKIIWMNEII